MLRYTRITDIHEDILLIWQSTIQVVVEAGERCRRRGRDRFYTTPD